MVVRARLLIAATVLLAVVWLLGAVWWGHRGTLGEWFLIRVLGPAVVTFGLLALYQWFARRSVLAPVLEVRDGAFVAPPRHLAVAALASAMLAMLLWVVGPQLASIVDDDSFGVALAVLLLVAALLAFGLHACRAVGVSFRDRPRIELRADGLVLLDAATSHDVPWDAIAVGPTPYPRLLNQIVVARPDRVRRRGLARLRPKARIISLPINVATHPPFVAAAINHYLFHPEHRAAIGSPQEYERLRQALTPPGGGQYIP